MAVAVKNEKKAAQARSENALAVSSLLGAIYVMASLALLFYALPRIWTSAITPFFLAEGQAVSAVDRALLALALVVVAAGLAVLGRTLAGATQPAGMRAGVFLAVLGFMAVVLLVSLIGTILENTGRIDPQAGMIIVGVLAVALLVGVGYLFFRPAAAQTLIAFEEQGWFSATSYKRTQGMRVRRATIMGFLIIAGCGVYSFLNRSAFVSAGRPHLEVPLPFSGGYMIRLLPDVAYTLPILLIGGSLWIGWRLVNFPPFADFLIATEAEMNKVSWTTRKRLIQDTLIVLTTMLLITMFLFVVDIVWFKVLSNPWVPILQTEQSTKSQELKQQEW
jgi:preprotein translocase SecE subunit